MNTEWIQCKLTTADVDEMRKKVKVGDTVKYPVLIFDRRKHRTEKSDLYVKKLVKATVTAKYPYLVEVRPYRQQGALPVCTMTYAELAAMKKGIEL